RAAGEEVALVAMLDTYLSADDMPAEDADEHSVIRWLAPHLNLAPAELKKLPLDEQWRRIAERANLAEGVGAAEIRRLAEVCQTHLAAFGGYLPQPYQGRVVLFRAEDADGLDPRWKALCPRLCVESVPGNHYSMLRQSNVEVWGNRLDGYLGENDAQTGAARDA
ncbi:MAG: hypothetical protein ABR915_05870, partial [Thermoguttaceae bacterium]